MKKGMMNGIADGLGRHSSRGFTLIELVLVLAITGVIVAGLWRLISSNNQQLRDQSAANLQSQLISSVKSFLAGDSNAQSWYQGKNISAVNAFQLPLPTVNNGVACTFVPAQPLLTNFCKYLPTGFTSGTTNSYDQTFSIMILGDGTGNLPTNYSFMIKTAGGDTIPDTSGGRIIGGIGNDGGFVYTNNVCTAANPNRTACGAYGSWSTTLAAYGMPNGSGVVASRTYVSPEQDAGLNWLARNSLLGVTYNTMTTTLYMSAGNNIDMASGGAPAGGGTLNMASGIIDMQGAAGKIAMNGGGITFGGSGTAAANTLSMRGGIISMGGGSLAGTNNDGSTITLFNPGTTPAQSPIRVSVPCTNCGIAAINVSTGDVSVPNGLVNASSLYAANFIYGTPVPTSDMRLKTDVKPIHDALGMIEELKPVTFVYKTSHRSSMGFIAQDMEKIHPELVINAPDGYKGITYEALIAPLVGAVQELKQDNDDLRTKLEQETLREEKMQQEIDTLKARPSP